jgi:hypothetical protein
MDKTVQVIQRYFSKNEAEFIVLQLSAVHEWEKSDSLFDKIANAPDKEVVLNHLAELVYGLIFSDLGGTVSFEPLGGTGPDLRVAKPEGSFLVEVSRFQQRWPGLAEFIPTGDSDLIPEYGNPERDTNKAYGKILEKLEKQCRYGPTVLALWNDDNELEEEFLDACQDIGADSKYPPEVLYVVCENKWCSPNKSQFFIYQASSDPPPFVETMMANLGKLRVSEAIARVIGVAE